MPYRVLQAAGTFFLGFLFHLHFSNSQRSCPGTDFHRNESSGRNQQVLFCETYLPCLHKRLFHHMLQLYIRQEQFCLMLQKHWPAKGQTTIRRTEQNSATFLVFFFFLFSCTTSKSKKRCGGVFAAAPIKCLVQHRKNVVILRLFFSFC